MSMNKLVIELLSPLGVPVAFHNYDGAAATYVTFFFYNEQGALYGDDEEIETTFGLQVDVWSKNDYTNLVKSIKLILVEADFERNFAADLFEEDTKIYHKVLRFNYETSNL